MFERSGRKFGWPDWKANCTLNALPKGLVCEEEVLDPGYRVRFDINGPDVDQELATQERRSTGAAIRAAWPIQEVVQS